MAPWSGSGCSAIRGRWSAHAISVTCRNSRGCRFWSCRGFQVSTTWREPHIAGSVIAAPCGRHADRIFHRKGHHVLIRTVHRLQVCHLEVAGEARLGTQTFGRHAVAGEAGDAVAAEGAVSGVGASGGDEVGVGERASGLSVSSCRFAHDAVAGVAGVVDFLCDRG